MKSVRSKSGVRVLSTEESGFPGLGPLLRLSWRLGSPSNLAAASRQRRSRARVTHHRQHDNEMLLDHVLFCLVSRNKCFYVHRRQYSLNVRRPRQLQNSILRLLLQSSVVMQTLLLVSCISQIRMSFVFYCLCLLF